MSLIKVYPWDVVDAHPPQEEVDEYLRERAELDDIKDPDTGEFTRPWSFEPVQGFFLQSAESTDDSQFDFLAQHFGRIPKSWKELIEKLDELNANAKPNVAYKLLFCARHGQGYHNYAVEVFGVDKWNEKIAFEETATLPDGTVIHPGPDPFLTDLGERQAGAVHESLEKEIAQGLPVPTKFFSSPFTRSASTLAISWNGIAVCKDSDDASKLKVRRHHPIVMETLRETIGEHLCDKRSSRTVFDQRLGDWGFVFEDGFVNEDVYWRPDWREPLSKQALRADEFFQHLFEQYPDDSVIYSASHAGMIKAIITAAHHRQFTIPTAGVIPIVLKGTRR